MRWKQVHEGRIVSVRITPFGLSLSQEADEIRVIVGEGISGDRHGGVKLSDVREVVLKNIGVGKEVPMANVRQFSAVSVEELAAIGEAMGTPTPIPYGLLGENLVIAGVPALTALSPGTLLTFSKAAGERVTNRKAVLAVWGENIPCYIPGDNIGQHFAGEGASFEPVRHFGVAANNRRGVVGFVYCSGVIKTGDCIGVWQQV